MYIPKNYLFKFKINFEMLDVDAWVEMREMDYRSTLELKQIVSSGNEVDILKWLMENASRFMVEHSFYADEKSKMKSEDVCSIIFDRTETANHFLNEFLSKSFFTGGKGKQQ